eukprot:COSAG04_NODE_23086_length_344_cov_0.804082_1_plen_81_part_01
MVLVDDMTCIAETVTGSYIHGQAENGTEDLTERIGQRIGQRHLNRDLGRGSDVVRDIGGGAGQVLLAGHGNEEEGDVDAEA